MQTKELLEQCSRYTLSDTCCAECVIGQYWHDDIKHKLKTVGLKPIEDKEREEFWFGADKPVFSTLGALILLATKANTPRFASSSRYWSPRFCRAQPSRSWASYTTSAPIADTLRASSARIRANAGLVQLVQRGAPSRGPAGGAEVRTEVQGSREAHPINHNGQVRAP